MNGCVARIWVDLSSDATGKEPEKAETPKKKTQKKKYYQKEDQDTKQNK